MADRIVHLRREAEIWPGRLSVLGDREPEELSLRGNLRLLERPLTGLFCSSRLPGDLLVHSFDVGRTLAAAGVPIISGFQSPIEREVLRLLLAGSSSVVVCPARSLETLKPPGEWQRAIESGRMLLLSHFPASIRRPTLQLCDLRNRIAAALASRVLVIHASPGGRLSRLVSELSGRGATLYCPEHPANNDLRVLGALPFPLRVDAWSLRSTRPAYFPRSC